MRIANATRRIATLLTIGALALASAACGDSSAGVPATLSASIRTTTAAVTIAAPSPISPPLGSTATPSVGVTGLFTDPRPAPEIASTRSLGSKPSTFASWDRMSTVLYDLQAHTETNLGAGSVGKFSPDGTKMVWIAWSPPATAPDGGAWLIDLTTMQKRRLGPWRIAAFLDNTHVGIASETGNDAESLDLTTGARAPLAGGAASLFLNTSVTMTPDGYSLRIEYRSANPFPKSQFYLTDASTGELLLNFEAYAAVPAGRGALAVATVPQLTGARDARGFGTGTTNIFLVDIASGNATFVATSRYAEPNWPLSADDRYVIWTEDYCAATQGRTRMYDRRTKQVIEIDATLWPRFTRDGLILDGPFGGTAILDPETLQYLAAIPADEAEWSTDSHYASLGLVDGHGGLCP